MQASSLQRWIKKMTNNRRVTYSLADVESDLPRCCSMKPVVKEIVKHRPTIL